MCNILLSPICGIDDAAGGVASAVGGSFIDSVSDSAGKAAGELVTKALGWWTYNGSVQFDSPVISEMQSNTMPITVILLALGVLVTGIKIGLSRKAEPLVNLLVNLVAFLVAATAGVALFAAIQVGGDSYSQWIIGQSSADFGDRLGFAATSGYASPFGVIVISLLCLLLAFVQWVLMLFRYAGLLVLACMLPVAGGAAVLQGKTNSLTSVLSWSIAILLYKPIAATVYAIGFTTIGDGKDLLTLLQGVVVLVLAIAALPALVKLFSWAGGHAPSGGGGGAALLGVAGGYAFGHGGGGNGSAGEQSSDLATSGPGSAGAGSGSADSPAPTPAGGAGGAGLPGASGAAGGASSGAAAGGGAAAGAESAAGANPYVAAGMAAKQGYDAAVGTASDAASDRPL